MKTIKENITSKYEINKSVFITKLIKINNEEEININLEDAKKEYKDATHYCYGYILDNKQKASDDKEPSGTAGTPILEVLNKNNLNHILCIVIRYFGGIKLGAGGLIRAYSTSVSNAIKNAELVSLVDGYIIKIESKYDNQSIIEKKIKDYKFKKEYFSNITFTVECDNALLDILKNNNIEFEIIDERKIELN